MPTSWSEERFPEFEQPIRRWVAQHRELKDEPLHLALTYLAEERDQRHIYLLEMIGTSGEGLHPDHDLFEAVFASSPGFLLADDEELHLILTNPREFDVALRQGWTLANEVVSAIRVGNFQILFEDELGRSALKKIQAWASDQANHLG